MIDYGGEVFVPIIPYYLLCPIDRFRPHQIKSNQSNRCSIVSTFALRSIPSHQRSDEQIFTAYDRSHERLLKRKEDAQ